MTDSVDSSALAGAQDNLGSAAVVALRGPITHTLKTDNAVFQDVIAGRKTFEIRKADRDFRAGDRLNLLETVGTGAEMAAGYPLEYTGGQYFARVLGVLHGPIYGLAEGWCVMSIAEDLT